MILSKQSEIPTFMTLVKNVNVPHRSHDGKVTADPKEWHLRIPGERNPVEVTSMALLLMPEPKQRLQNGSWCFGGGWS